MVNLVFTFVSQHLGADVFRRASEIPVMLIFVGLTFIFAIEIPTAYCPGILVAAS